MKIINQTSFPVLVACYVEVRGFGLPRMVMPKESENVHGPLLVQSPEGDVYIEVKGTFTIVEGESDNPDLGTLAVTLRRPRSHVWKTPQGNEGVRVIHFRYGQK
jgi:hypothetical protein